MQTEILGLLGAAAGYAGFKYLSNKTATSMSNTTTDFMDVNIIPDSDVIIILIAWGAADPRHVRKFEEQYWAKGYSTITTYGVLTFLLDMGLAHGLYIPVMQELHKVIGGVPESARHKKKIFTHSFSGTGFNSVMCFEGLLEMDNFSWMRPLYRGRILDCSGWHPMLAAVPLPSEFKDCVAEKHTVCKGDALDKQLALPGLTTDVDVELSPEVLEATRRTLRLKDEFSRVHLPHKLAKQTFMISLVAVSCILRRNQYFHPIWTPLVAPTIALMILKERCWYAWCKLTGKTKTSLYEHLIQGDFIKFCHEGMRLPPLAVPFPPKTDLSSDASKQQQQPAVEEPDTADGTPSLRQRRPPAASTGAVSAEEEDALVESIREWHSFDAQARKFFLSGQQHVDADVAATLVNNTPSIVLPELFMLSKKDVLTPGDHIQRNVLARLVARQDARAVNPDAKLPPLRLVQFRDAPHVGLMRLHPEAYMHAVFTFIEDAIAYQA